ncbi:MAG TPA: lysylphosphatidylglycerol synthase transmembrane domain-containing protein [Polyangiales bacterium]
MSRALNDAPRRARWRRLLPIVGVCLLAWVLSRLDLAQLARALARVSPLTIAISCAWFSANLWLKVWRWQRLLAAQGIVLPHRIALATFMSAQFYAQVTVGRVGEFVRIEALTERGIGAGTALSSCVFDRLLDVFLVLFAGSVLGAFVLGRARAALTAALLLVVLAAVAMLLLQIFARKAAEDDARWVEHRPFVARALRMLRELARGITPMLRARVLVEAIGWTVLAWSGYFAALFALADGLHLLASHVLLVATASFAALSALLPVTISGLGARELIYIEVLRGHGVPAESAVALSLLHLTVMSICAIALGLFGVLARLRQRRRS